MSLRKKINNLEFDFEHHTHSDIEKLRRTVDNVITRIEKREQQIKVLEYHANHHIHPEEPVIPKILDRLETLERQVQCGINGHSFVLQSLDILDENTTTEATIGDFICSACGAETVRKLTADEIKAAKKLGF